MEAPDLSIVMPCLNEEATVGRCVEDAQAFLAGRSLRGEVIVADNGSTDASARIAAEHGARVIRESRQGYGFALRAGIAEARGKVIILGDCDCTYDFLHLDNFYAPLARGEYDLMVGDRFAGGIGKGAMPLTHRAGVKALSWLGRRRYRTDVRDFHCGLRGLTGDAARRLSFQTGGMEFATEMIALAAAAGLRIGQCPTPLHPCDLPRRSKLRPVPDGFRHLRYILNSPSGFGEGSGR